jgi:hypothetical protein
LHGDPHAHIPTRPTGSLPPASPKTGAQIGLEEVGLVRNHMARTLVVQYREAKTQEWQALQREWEAATAWEAATTQEA